MNVIPQAKLPHNRVGDAGVAVTEDHRPEGHRKVDVAVPVDVPDVRALGPLDVGRRDALHPLCRVLAESLRVRRDHAPCALEPARRLAHRVGLGPHGSTSIRVDTTRSTSSSAIPGKIGSEIAPA